MSLYDTKKTSDIRIIAVKRKCSCCKTEMNITKNNISDCIYFDKQTYHKSCFEKMLNIYLSKGSKRRISAKREYALNHKSEIQKNSYDHFLNALNKEYLFEFIKSQYDITVIPTNIWNKLANIYSGKFKGMTEGNGIPPTHLLDMWKRKINKLNNIAAQNQKRNKIMTPEQRLNYDISVLVNMYDSYLRFLNNQKILASETEKKAQTPKESLSLSYFQNLSPSNKTENTENEEKDISAMVDEIFG